MIPALVVSGWALGWLVTAVLLARYVIDDLGETCHGEYVEGDE